MGRQTTLKSSIHCTGTGLHSGAKVSIALHPAEAGSGIAFRRTDLPGGPVIAADWRNVAETTLSTTLGNQAGVRVGTIEHLMAALFGCEIDNALIELDGPEVPIMDGSAAPFVFLIECAGVVEQNQPRRAIEILRRVSVGDGERGAGLAPGRGLSIDFEIAFENTLLRRQNCHIDLRNGTFKSDISRARTFAFEHEVGQMRAAGLARGGSLDNAVVISGARVLNHDGLRYDDEFVRHKVLDCIGDLYLAGAPVLGRFHGRRSGHHLNNKLLHALFADKKAWRYVEMDANTGAKTAALA